MTHKTLHSTFAAILFMSLVSVGFAGCKGAAGSPSGSAASGSETSSSAAEASFSYSMDGMSFSGKGSDDIGNCAFKGNNGTVNFVLMNMDPNQKGVPTQIHIFAPANGTATFKSGDDKYSVDYRYADKDGNNTHSYQMTSMTVTILSNTGTRLSGTFSGNFEVLNENRDTQLTDGKFDIPYSAHSPK